MSFLSRDGIHTQLTYNDIRMNELYKIAYF